VGTIGRTKSYDERQTRLDVGTDAVGVRGVSFWGVRRGRLRLEYGVVDYSRGGQVAVHEWETVVWDQRDDGD